MDIKEIIKQLEEERNRIDAALIALTVLPLSDGKSAPSKRRRRKLSASARKKIAEAQRKRWAKQKGTTASK
jgi:hypothetical protein